MTVPAAPSRRRAVAWGLGVLLLPFAVFWRLWMPEGRGAAHLWGDTNGTYWPDLIYLHRALVRGELPLWNPWERGGVPILCDPEAGVLYPLNWLLALASLPWGGVPFWMIEVKACLHLGLAGVATLGWLQARGLGRLPALGAAVVVMLGPFSLANAHFSLIWALPWLPCALWCGERVLATGSRWAAVGMGGSGALLLLAGSPPAAFYAALFGLGWLALSLGVRARAEGARALLGRVGAPLAVALALALLLAWPSLAGTVESMRHSGRAVRDAAYMNDGAITPRELRALVLPGASARYFHLGLPAALLGLVGLVRARRRPEVWLGAAFVGLGAGLMVGPYGPLLPLAHAWLPPFRLFTDPSRYVLLVQLGAAVLAAWGLAALARRPWLARLALLVVTLDLALVGQRSGVLRPGRFNPEQATRLAPEALARLQADPEPYRVFAEHAVTWRPGTRHALRDFRGYRGPLSLARLDQVYRRLRDDPRPLGLYNVRWLLHGPHPYHGYAHNVVRRVRVKGVVEREPHLFELPRVAPPAFWVAGALLVATPEEAVAALGGLQADGDLVLARADLPEAAAARAASLVARRGSAVREPAPVVMRRLSELELLVRAPAEGWLVVNEVWFPGWEAEVDGVPAPVLRGNHLVMVLPVEAGEHRVRLRFRPTYVFGPLALAVAALVAALAWAGRGSARARRAARPPPPDGS